MKCDKCNAEVTIGEWPFCPHGRALRSRTSDPIFPFTLNHVDGKPMTIESLHHLRQVESKYGVVFSAFAKDNVNDVDPIKNPPRYRGDDPDFERRR